VEATWGLDSPEMLSLLEACTEDENNRVVGNALIGLNFAGTKGVAEEIVRISLHEQASFRATAAWMMGKVADPAFLDPLQRLLRDDWAQVKGAALRAMLCLPRIDGGRVDGGAEAAAARGSEVKPEAPGKVAPVLQAPPPVVPLLNLRPGGSAVSSTQQNIERPERDSG
jgi:HEAT repeat protein